MKVLPLSEVKMKLSQLVEEVSSLDEEITITRNGKPVAIIVSPDEFDSWKETLAIRADAELMATSLEVILSDPAVRSVLVNIFGGITRGDVVAEGILDALKRVEAHVPIVVRLDGTNAEEGRRILTEAGHERIVPAATMLEAAQKAVDLAKAGVGG